ncbi:MAG: type 4a pilus biogenesis protein PilO [Desulfobulbaceae bacterium]|nr:type 4a pilus biogenesis protein PilO [Desulfobulbaceae bacterium]
MADDNLSTKIDTFINKKYIPLDKKIKIVIAVLLVAVPIGLFVYLSYMPNVETIKKMEGKKISLAAEVAKAEKVARNLKKYEDELVEAQKHFEAIAVVLPKSKEIPNLLRNISDLGKGAGLDFVSFQPGGEKPKDFYAEIPVNISIRGPYHNVGYFLDQVSKLDRIVTANNIKLGSPKKVGNEMILSSSCSLLTYRYTGKSLAPPPK